MPAKSQYMGYVRLFRSLLGSPVFANPELLKVWIWCLLRANYQTQWVQLTIGTGYTEVKVERGQFLFGRNTAAAELQMPPSTLWSLVKKLGTKGFIKIESSRNYSLITIIDYEKSPSDKVTRAKVVQPKRSSTANDTSTLSPKEIEQFLLTNSSASLEQIRQQHTQHHEYQQIVTDYWQAVQNQLPETISTTQVTKGFERYYQQEWGG